MSLLDGVKVRYLIVCKAINMKKEFYNECIGQIYEKRRDCANP